MNKPYDGNEHDDDNIAQVFNAQRVTVPGDLRHMILQQASIEAEKNLISSATDDHGSRSIHTPKGMAAFTQKQGALSAAIAASIVVLIIGVPFTFDSTESDTAQSMDKQNVEAQDVEARTIQAETDSVSMTRAPAQTDETNQSAEPASLAFEEAETLRMTDQKSKAANAPQATSARRAPAYRQSADTWINQIKVLIADGQPARAEEEYTLLEQQFPAEAKDYNPDFTRRITEIPDEDPDPIGGARR